MDVINDLTSSLSSDLNSTELAKDLGLGFLAKSTAINGAVNLGIKLLEILFTLFLCWLMIRISSKLVNKFLRTQVQREKLSMSERKAKTLSTVTGSILKYVIYFIGLMSILKQLGVSSESLVVIASAGSVAIGLGAQSIAGDMMEGFFILFEEFFDNVYLLFRFCDDIIFQSNLLSFLKIDLMVYSYHDAFHKELLNNYRRLHLHSFCELTDCHFLRKCDFFYFWFLLFLFWLRSRFLKSFRNSGKISSSALIRSVVTCTGIFLKIFLFVLILSVTLSLAVLGCFCQFRCEYGIIISSSAAGSLSATVISAKASFTSVIRSSVSALSWSSLATLLRENGIPVRDADTLGNTAQF